MGNLKSKLRDRDPMDCQEIQQVIENMRMEQAEIDYLTTITHFDSKTVTTLYDVFSRISAYNVADNRIDPTEFAIALGLPCSSMLARRLFSRFNVTNSASMNFREFIMALSQLSTRATQDEKIKFSFDLYDLNKDRSIDRSELTQLLQAALEHASDDIKLSKEQISEICEKTVQQMDIDGNGKIEFEEYAAMVKRNPRLLDAFTLDIHTLVGRFDSVASPRDDAKGGGREESVSRSAAVPRMEVVPPERSLKKVKIPHSGSSTGLSACGKLRSKSVKAVVINDEEQLDDLFS